MRRAHETKIENAKAANKQWKDRVKEAVEADIDEYLKRIFKHDSTLIIAIDNDASMPGVLPAPLEPSWAVHRVNGCDQDVDAFRRRAVPIKPDAKPKSGTTT